MRLELLLSCLLIAEIHFSTSLATPADLQKVIDTKGPFDTIRDALKKAEIIDGIVDDFVPKCFVTLFYEKKTKAYPVVLGNALKPSKTQDSPSLKIYCPDLESTSGLTIILTDPDAPSRDNPKWSEMCHWIGITEGYTSNATLSKVSKEVVKYKAPGPPAKTDYHRYVFLLLEGDNSNLTAPEDRQHWGFGKKDHGVRDWAKQEGLEVIGANFFYAKNKKQ
ncbi:Carboxypeptidase Y inhibitor [Hyphodiscus hymeniophilus]|uniref:Carboxypeptidase Y inhibitor n=1 Tax=Hyphodiscus hymeniophilus TaxID=353542 RepID=A0A9P6VHM5_9HELO|nr:Carboxypeptidase Y inhibitor [Hyphodiscus hymeniophilus]